MKLSVTVLLLIILLSSPSVFANEMNPEGISQERIDLFVASQRMLIEERTPPRMKVGMVLNNFGSDGEVSFGVRVESRIDQQNKVSVISETTYLKEEKTMAGFLSLKVSPFSGEPISMYLGAGAGYADGFRYQVFAGVDLTKNMYAEVRYANLEGGLGGRGIFLATGFQFTF